MPILDWTRTDLDFPMPDGSTGLRFDATEFAAFELYILQRSGAAQLHTDEQKQQAKARLDSITDEQVNRLTRTIIAGLPGLEETYTVEQFRSALDCAIRQL